MECCNLGSSLYSSSQPDDVVDSKFEEDSGISLEAIAVEDEVTPGPAVPQDDTMSDHDLALLLQVGLLSPLIAFMKGRVFFEFDLHSSSHRPPVHAVATHRIHQTPTRAHVSPTPFFHTLIFLLTSTNHAHSRETVAYAIACAPPLSSWGYTVATGRVQHRTRQLCCRG